MLRKLKLLLATLVVAGLALVLSSSPAHASDEDFHDGTVDVWVGDASGGRVVTVHLANVNYACATIRYSQDNVNWRNVRVGPGETKSTLAYTVYLRAAVIFYRCSSNPDDFASWISAYYVNPLTQPNQFVRF